jgi:hypothetical protein
VRAVESQNHYYGHSGAFARYLGLDRPRHIRGLVQHGWTAVSPLETHFRDFPAVGRPGGRTDRSLFVWSHASRAWDPSRAARASVAIGAPWVYLATAEARRAEDATTAREPGPPAAGTVVFPVHGIPTQRLHGDHARVARHWADVEGPATVCLYHVEADDPRIVAAYRDAGHTCVTLGERTDGAFLSRLHRLLEGARRVVSNRLSTPLLYAAALGREVAVSGDAMEIEGEDVAARNRLRDVWPELHDPGVGIAVQRAVARAEIGWDELRAPAELATLLGWDRTVRVGPWLEHWTVAPASRAVTTVRRRASATAPVAPGPASGASATPALAFLRGAVSYLPRPLQPVVPLSAVAPRPLP